MVRTGMAVSYGRYGAEEAAARRGRAGLWAGQFESPRAFRERAEPFDLWSWITGWFGT
jgi:endonuclease YncB( thermonuclease family)